MIVVCPECHTEYKLDPQKLGSEGRTVRCTTCRHMWTQKHVPEKDITAVIAEAIAPEPEPEPEPVAPPPAESFEVVLQNAAAATPAVILPPQPPAPKMPDVLKPKLLDSTVSAPITYKVMGMGPEQFGLLTFLLCAFVSLSALFLSKDLLVHTWPAFSEVYRTMGFDVRAPGEGLRFDGVTAENRIDEVGRKLVVEGKLANISDQKMAYPVMQVTLKSGYGAVLKSWMLDAKDKPPLASGESAAVKSEFSDAPEGGTSVEMKVVQP